MKENASEKSLNSNTRCKFPFTTLQPSSLASSAEICCSDSFAVAMKSSRGIPHVAARFSKVHEHYPPPARAGQVDRASPRKIALPTIELAVTQQNPARSVPKNTGRIGL